MELPCGIIQKYCSTLGEFLEALECPSWKLVSTWLRTSISDFTDSSGPNSICAAPSVAPYYIVFLQHRAPLTLHPTAWLLSSQAAGAVLWLHHLSSSQFLLCSSLSKLSSLRKRQFLPVLFRTFENWTPHSCGRAVISENFPAVQELTLRDSEPSSFTSTPSDPPLPSTHTLVRSSSAHAFVRAARWCLVIARRACAMSATETCFHSASCFNASLAVLERPILVDGFRPLDGCRWSRPWGSCLPALRQEPS